jgi:hypothetical protein
VPNYVNEEAFLARLGQAPVSSPPRPTWPATSALHVSTVIDSSGLDEPTRWTTGASFPPGHMLGYERYGLGLGANTVDRVDLHGQTGFIGASRSTHPISTRSQSAPTTPHTTTAGRS